MGEAGDDGAAEAPSRMGFPFNSRDGREACRITLEALVKEIRWSSVGGQEGVDVVETKGEFTKLGRGRNVGRIVERLGVGAVYRPSEVFGRSWESTQSEILDIEWVVCGDGREEEEYEEKEKMHGCSRAGRE